MTRLGEGLARGGVIIDAALERTAAAIAGMVDEAKQCGVRALAAVGTAGFRIASNGNQVVAAIQARTGVLIEVITGEEEAGWPIVAAKVGLGLNEGSLVVFDTGGGSSQFTFGHDAVVDERFSVDVGAVRYTERYRLDDAVSSETLREAIAAISADLSRVEGRPTPDALVAMGGAVTNITAVKHGLATYDPEVVQGSVLDRVEVDRQIELYRSRNADARRAIVGLQPKRAEVILAGACIVRTVMEKLGKAELHRQRPRPAPRRAGRAFRSLTGLLCSVTEVLPDRTSVTILRREAYRPWSPRPQGKKPRNPRRDQHWRSHLPSRKWSRYSGSPNGRPALS